MGRLGVDAPGLEKKKWFAQKYSAAEIPGPVFSLLGVDCKKPAGKQRKLQECNKQAGLWQRS